MPEMLLNDSNALGFMRSEHQRVEQLIASCMESNEVEFTRQATRPLLSELAIHDSLENDLFFPFMSRYIDKATFDRPLRDNADVRALAGRLENTEPGTVDYFETLRTLAEKFHHHDYLEEQYVMVPVEMADPDTQNLLIELGSEMRLRRDEMLKQARPVPVNRVASRQAKAETREAMLEDNRTDISRRETMSEDTRTDMPPRGS